MKNFRKILITMYLLACASAFPQNQNEGGSPYTIFGIGDLNYSTSTRTYSMGIAGTALFGNYVNNLNPATVTKLNSTLIATNFYYGFLKSSNGIVENKISNGNILGVNIGIPFDQIRGWVMTIGFNPVSLVNYKVNLSGKVDEQSYTQTYSGEGGLSRINLGMTYNIFRKISIGLEYNYAFGEIKNQNFVNFNNSNYINTLIKKETDFQKSFVKGGVVFEIGRLFNSFTIRNLSLGFAYQSGFNLDATRDGIYTTNAGTDTVRLNNGTVDIPSMYSIGISNLFGSRYLVSGDVILQDWSKFREFGSAVQEYQNSFRAGLGLEILPDPASTSFWGSMTYRIGGFYDKAYYKVSGQDVNSYGGRVGVNIPLSQYNSIDFGINYSIRGKEGNGLIKDEYLNFTASVNFGELWFLRPREEDQ
ncbi:MAG: hypothetical protein HGGPFJEG_01915 [Ignavibacteria bacterium]|nr:hypothetical protein [Ignavibacteria bacterium]